MRARLAGALRTAAAVVVIVGAVTLSAVMITAGWLERQDP